MNQIKNPMIQFNNRTINDNGDVEYNEQGIIDLMISGWDFKTPILVNDLKLVDDLNNQFNLYGINKQILLATSNNNDWYYPEEYNNIILLDYFIEKLADKIKDISEEYINRVILELKLFKDYNFEQLLRFIIYFIDMLKKNNIVYGVGRGSSVSSLLLYLIDLHCVDPIKFKLDIYDFFH